MADTPPDLSADDFPAFYEAVHGYAPFPWQSDLVAHVLTEGRWPDLIDVPTGLGKTSMLDIAVFVAAATAQTFSANRLGRRRCFFVVDRRIVVDEATTHATNLANILAAAEGQTTVLGRVAAELRSYAPTATGALLPVTRMRGGATWDAAWLDRPDRPGIVLGTVDQVGSRLLFRGYGVSDRRRPLDAALVGTDSLILVDEAHLAAALLSTVTAAQQRDTLGLDLPGLDVVRLSATGASTEHTYRLDVDAHRDDPVAWRRLTAAKRLMLQTSTAKTVVRDIARTVTDRLSELVGDQAPVALVVCNTVDRAREVHTLLLKSYSDAELLIGRSRPHDRAGLQDRILERFGTGRKPALQPAVLVATQTVEVGVNLDVDVLVTESASWDALVQRLGRLNRLGEFTTRFPGPGGASAVVVHDGQADGPVYGAARDNTWAALTDQVPADGQNVSPLLCRSLTEQFATRAVTSVSGEIPVLLTPTLDAWVQTAPIPLNDPPVAPYLQGIDTGTAPVQVLWRDGLTEPAEQDGFVDPFDDEFADGGELATAVVDAMLAHWPPRTGEIVEIPFLAARRWITGQPSGPIADLDGVAETDARVTQVREPFRVLAQRSSRTAPDTPLTWQWIEAEQIRPGDVLVVPIQRGGLDKYGFFPASTNPVLDVSEPVAFQPSRARRDAALRLDKGLPDRLGITDPDARAVVGTILTDIGGSGRGDADIVDHEQLVDALREHLPSTAPSTNGWTDETWGSLQAWLHDDRLHVVEVTDPADARIAGAAPRVWLRLLVAPCPTPDTTRPSGAVAERDDEDTIATSVSAGQVTLNAHHDAVGARARQIADALVLSDPLRTVVVDAARWHDLGKNDTRFQVMLHDGDTVAAALAPQPLAKSGMDPSDRMAWRRAARLSGLPAGARHEAWSAALVADHVTHHPYPGDTDLLIHLVASHHGYARPLARLVIDPEPRPVEAVIDGDKTAVSSGRTVALDHPGRFARLNQRYGRWGLALLESIVRSADTTVSGEGS